MPVAVAQNGRDDASLLRVTALHRTLHFPGVAVGGLSALMSSRITSDDSIASEMDWSTSFRVEREASKDPFCVQMYGIMLQQPRATETIVAPGLAIRARRVRLRLSQEALAAAVGLHRTYIGSVERGERNVSLNNIIALAGALGTSASGLLSEAERIGWESH